MKISTILCSRLSNRKRSFITKRETIAKVILTLFLNRDLTDKPNRNRNRIESESGFKGDSHISVVVIGNVCYCDWESKWNSIA